MNFIGNVEGRDMFSGQADVIVCDGFTGNVALKTSEGVFEFIMQLLRHEMMASIQTKAGALLTRPAFRQFKKRLDYAEYGGAPLLGIKGVTVICHEQGCLLLIHEPYCFLLALAEGVAKVLICYPV